MLLSATWASHPLFIFGQAALFAQVRVVNIDVNQHSMLGVITFVHTTLWLELG